MRVRRTRSTLARAAAAVAALLLAATLPGTHAQAADASTTSRPRADIRELPVPPTVPADGVCTHATGCVSADWSGIGTPGFSWDPNYMYVGINYAGAPASGPASIYSGPQVVVERTDGKTFPNGEAWKCITCGVSFSSDIATSQLVYPPAQEFPDGKRVLVANGVLHCGANGADYAVTDRRCTPANTHIDPVYWNGRPLFAANSDGSQNGREWRLSPDGVHLVWDTLDYKVLNEYPFVGRLTYDASNQRYHLTNVSVLQNPSAAYQPWVVKPGNRLKFNPAGLVGEMRGWTSDGRSTLGIGTRDADNIDAWATDLATGTSRQLTSDAQYTDPLSMSPNGKWLLAEEVKGSGRLDFISGMTGVPSLTNMITTGYVAQIRNNGNRRFFSPWLVDPDTGRGFQINAGSDPDWNAAADPAWLADGTGVVYSENLACGANPTPHKCADSTEPGGRNSRLMIARFPWISPTRAVSPAPASDTTWGLPYTGDTTPPQAKPIATGTYTLPGRHSGSATVTITDDSTGSLLLAVSATYHAFSDNGTDVINGTEQVTRGSNASLGCTAGTATALSCVTWTEDLTLSGRHTGTKRTGPGGFTLGPSVLIGNDFQAVGTLTTTIDGTTYAQPANGS
ncbi:hypothetical protein ACIPSJ_40210 [Streptomyces sp. NPDC090088]|uniref:hypothetical protein n=1 Tax=Streptomyces sp. NPDC090088 TaxID=3365944 RepID=UPI003819B4A7